MKISIHREGKLREFMIPNGLLFNPVTAGVLVSVTKNQEKHLYMKGCLKLMQQFQKVSHSYPDWPLVELESSDGERITIII